ncbi:RHS repeat-associated core domain-containing protein, partial [Nitrospirales bacterium NOB]|nr:RHS repeat-associated core domain-containing protein [Nitrospirales bacterium NOB]
YSSSRIFVYDGWNNLIAYNPAGGLSIHRKNTWGLDLSGLNGNAAPGGIHGAGGIGGLIGSTVANALPPPSYICFYDANGNLGETIKNSDGTLWSHHEYDPWGKQLVKYETAGMAHPFRYSTKYSDGLFEKYYFGYRYDHYFLGRFITRDLIAELGGANLYVFVKNAPTQLIDADGLMPGGRLPIRQPPPQVQPPLPPPTDPPPPPPPTSGPASVWVPCPPQPFDVINQHVRVPCFTPPPEFRPAAYAMCCDGQCGAWLRSRPSDDAVFYCRVAHECDHCVDAQVNYGLNCENQPDGNKVYGGPIRIDPGSVGGGGTQPPIPEECTAYTEQVRCLLEHCDTPWSRSPCASELCTMLCRRSYHCQQGGSWSDEDRRWCEMMCSLIFGNRE